MPENKAPRDTTSRGDRVQEFLWSARDAKIERQYYERRLRRLRADSERITASYGLKATGRSGDGRRDASLAALADQETALCDKIAAYWNRVRMVDAFIASLPDPRHRLILRLRYADGLSWPRIFARLPEYGYWYEERQVFRLHGDALQEARARFDGFVRAASKAPDPPRDGENEKHRKGLAT